MNINKIKQALKYEKLLKVFKMGVSDLTDLNVFADTDNRGNIDRLEYVLINNSTKQHFYFSLSKENNFAYFEFGKIRKNSVYVKLLHEDDNSIIYRFILESYQSFHSDIKFKKINTKSFLNKLNHLNLIEVG